VRTGGRIDYVTQFSLIAVFILIIACINFMNLSTAKASRRIKEVGIKKALGAGRIKLATQHIGESMLMTFLSLCVAVLLVDVCLPKFNEITGKALTLEFNPTLVLSLLGILVVTGVTAGSYPALYLSAFNPASVLKGKFSTTLGELWARKGLVVFQFTLSVVFIVCVVVIYRQIEFLQRKNLGYNKDHIIYFEIEGKIAANPQTFVEEMKKVPGVINASVVSQSMVGGGNTTNITWEGKDPEVKIPFAVRPVGYDVMEMLDLEFVDGRPFKREFTSDSSAVIFNESAIKAMGMTDPIEKTISLAPGMDFQIIGVVKDFHYESLHENVGPLFFVLRPQFARKVIAKLDGTRQTEALGNLQKFYQEFNPGFVFDYRFMDADYQSQYFAELRIGRLSKYSASLAILISCLGLFGLAAFTAERRLKEIGIRKVLGSTEMGIIYLLSSDFTKIVFVAILIALPVSYLIVSAWLKNFAFSIPLEWWYFAGAGVAALFIAWCTVGTQAFKAARVNPSKCLRDE
jgi:putative ABC transport system permease protein